MITRRTKVQLLVFAIITLLGVTYVGARYAKLDEALIDRSYVVVAHYPESGGIFAGGEVTYRGVQVGKVSKLELTDEGVDVYLEIEDSWDRIPADTKALVGNRSAVGEQYVELQPNVDVDEDGPFLEDDSEITEVETPIATEKLLGDIATTVSSVDQEALRTTVKELGIAFGGTGEDLQQIIDTGNSFIQTANDNFAVTTALIRDSNIVLRGQRDSERALRTFADSLSVFSESLVAADGDLRRVIDSGSFTANQLRTFLEQNQVPLAELLNSVITTGNVVVRNLPGVKQLLVLYPYVVSGSYGVVDQNEEGHWDAHIGLILNPPGPESPFTTTQPCYEGYETNTRGPQQREDLPLPQDVHCAEPPEQSNPRGVQNLPRTAPDYVLSLDQRTGEVAWGQEPALTPTGSVAPPSLGEDSWKWLYLQPLLDNKG